MVQPAKRNLVTIEDSTIQALLGRKDLITRLPACFELAAKQQRRTRMRICASCQPASRRNGIDYGRIKQCLAHLQGANRRLLKTVLNARQIRIVYRNGHGQRITFTF